MLKYIIYSIIIIVIIIESSCLVQETSKTESSNISNGHSIIRDNSTQIQKQLNPTPSVQVSSLLITQTPSPSCPEYIIEGEFNP